MMIVKSLEQLDKIKSDCRSMVNSRALMSGGAAAVPGAVAGVAADIGLFSEMLPRINRKFGLSQEQVDELGSETRERVFLFAGKLGNIAIGRLVTKEIVSILLKRVGVGLTTKAVASYVPFVGQAVAAGISFGLMRAVGNSHVNECYDVVRQLLQEQGGTSEAAEA